MRKKRSSGLVRVAEYGNDEAKRDIPPFKGKADLSQVA